MEATETGNTATAITGALLLFLAAGALAAPQVALVPAQWSDDAQSAPQTAAAISIPVNAPGKNVETVRIEPARTPKPRVAPTQKSVRIETATPQARTTSTRTASAALPLSTQRTTSIATAPTPGITIIESPKRNPRTAQTKPEAQGPVAQSPLRFSPSVLGAQMENGSALQGELAPMNGNGTAQPNFLVWVFDGKTGHPVNDATVFVTIYKRYYDDYGYPMERYVTLEEQSRSRPLGLYFRGLPIPGLTFLEIPDLSDPFSTLSAKSVRPANGNGEELALHISAYKNGAGAGTRTVSWPLGERAIGTVIILDQENESTQPEDPACLTLHESGPDALDVVFVASGYEAEQLPYFYLSAMENAGLGASQGILNIPPFDEYTDAFNVYAVPTTEYFGCENIDSSCDIQSVLEKASKACGVQQSYPYVEPTDGRFIVLNANQWQQGFASEKFASSFGLTNAPQKDVYRSPQSDDSYTYITIHEFGHTWDLEDEYIDHRYRETGRRDRQPNINAPNLDVIGCPKWCSGTINAQKACYKTYLKYEDKKHLPEAGDDVVEILNCNVGVDCQTGTGCWIGAVDYTAARPTNYGIMNTIPTWIGYDNIALITQDDLRYGPVSEEHIRNQIEEELWAKSHGGHSSDSAPSAKTVRPRSTSVRVYGESQVYTDDPAIFGASSP